MKAGRSVTGVRLTRTQLRHHAREAKIATTGYARALLGSGGDLPGALIIGAQRAGTTSLFNYLAVHPEVRAPHSKELQYFSLHYSRGPQWYRGNFPSVGPRELTFEASPLYLFDDRSPSRVHDTIPDVRLIALLRDPVERAYSHYLHNVQHGVERLSFAEAVRAEPARIGLAADGSMTESRRRQRQFSYLSRGRYAEQLRRWYDAFPADQVIVLRSEDLYAAPEQTYATVLGFLGLAPHAGVQFGRHNHWVDKDSQLTPQLRVELQERFREPNAEVGQLLGWSTTWEFDAPQDADA